MHIKISRWCPSRVYFISGQKLPHSGNAGLVLYVEYTQPTGNVNETKTVSAKQGEAFLFPCTIHTLLFTPRSQMQILSKTLLGVGSKHTVKSSSTYRWEAGTWSKPCCPSAESLLSACLLASAWRARLSLLALPQMWTLCCLCISWVAGEQRGQGESAQRSREVAPR